MSNTPTPHSSKNISIVNVKVFVDDDIINSTYQLTELTIYKHINKINKADIHFFDGDVAEGTFPIMESNDFKPGKSIKIELGYGTGEEDEIAFQGVICDVELHTSSNQQPIFLVKCMDEVFKMSLNNRYLLYEDTSDADLFGEIIDRYSTIDKGKIVSTSFSHPSIVQFGINDWDFILNRAKKIGCIVYNDENTLTIKKPEVKKASIAITFGKDIIRQQLRLSAKSIFDNVQANSWNATDQVLRTEDASEIAIPNQGDNETETSNISSDFIKEPQKILTHADLDTPVVSDWASGALLRYELNKISGFVIIPGTNAPKLDSVVEIVKSGNYFSGDGYITGIEHTVKSGKWITKLSIGLQDKRWFSSLSNDTRSGHVQGLQIGLVKQIHNDPAGNTRILVEIPGVEGKSEGVWARVLQRYATNGAGSFIFPEVGNEVVMGFLSQDPHAPIVLGSLYSQTNAPPLQVEEENKIKSFYSREQLQFSFNEEKKETTLSTPAGNKLILSDDLKGIHFEDQSGNKIILDNNGILMESQSDLKVKTKGDMIFEAMGKTSIKSSSGDVSVEGMNIKLNANVKIEEKANIIESKATAQAVIKGGVVQIN